MQSVDDYFPLLTEQTMQLYALRMRDNEDQVDIVVSDNILLLCPIFLSFLYFRLIVYPIETFWSMRFISFKIVILHYWVAMMNVLPSPISLHMVQVIDYCFGFVRRIIAIVMRMNM